MASLRYIVNHFQEELCAGMAWVAFWKEGRAWKAECFWPEPIDDRLSMEEKTRLEEISHIDPGAVILNGYYCSYFREDMSITEMVFGVRCHYENSYNDVLSFIKSHAPVEIEEKNGMGDKDKYILEYLDLCLKYTNLLVSVAEVDEAEEKQTIKRIHELRHVLGMEPIRLGGMNGKSLMQEGGR